MNKKVKRIEMFNESLPRLGLGMMRLPLKDTIIDQQQVNDMVSYALEHGVNYFDTAILYHETKSEDALGVALEAYPRESYFIADKMSFWDAKTPEYLDKTFDISCRKLKTEYFDFYLMHCLNEDTLAMAKNVDAFNWAIQKKKEGKIKHLGFSIHASYEVLLEILELADWDFAQIQYNYMDLNDNPGQKGYDELVKRNIPVMIMEPLKGGFLVDLPDNIAAPYIELGQSNQSMAFRWLAEQPMITTILSGMSNMEQLKNNIDIFTDISPLSQSEHQAITKVTANINATKKVNCTGCKYCMPCPVGVDIAENFRAWNLQSMNNSKNWISGTAIDKEMIAKCVECGQCMTHCPQNIKIPDVLKQILAE